MPRHGPRHQLYPPAKIRALRDHLGVSQAGLAERLGVHVGSVSAWEQGRKTPTWAVVPRLRALEAAAGMPPEVAPS